MHSTVMASEHTSHKADRMISEFQRFLPGTFLIERSTMPSANSSRGAMYKKGDIITAKRINAGV